VCTLEGPDAAKAAVVEEAAGVDKVRVADAAGGEPHPGVEG